MYWIFFLLSMLLLITKIITTFIFLPLSFVQLSYHLTDYYPYYFKQSFQAADTVFVPIDLAAIQSHARLHSTATEVSRSAIPD